MNKSMRAVIGICSIVIGLIIMFNIGFAKDAGDKFDVGSIFDKITGQESSGQSDSRTKSESMSGVKTVLIDGTSENIKVETYSGDEIKVVMTADKSVFKKSKAKLILEKKGDEVRVTVDYPKVNMFNFGSIKLDITIPEDFSEEFVLDMTSGDFEMTDELSLKNLKIDITSGNVEIENMKTDNTRIDASSGDVNIEGMLGDLKGDISSGNVTIVYEKFDNDIDFGLTSGNLNIYLDKNAEFEFESNVTSGDIDLDFELDNEHKDGNDISGEVGNSNNTIKIDMTSGNVDINKN